MNKFNIVVASGKGGVGKSMIASSLAILFSKKNRVLALDCDVDAPNLDIWLGKGGEWDETKRLKLVSLPKIDYNKCNGCGKCAKNCQFGALKMKDNKPKINNFICEGCGVCKEVCPEGAITMEKTNNAYIKSKITEFGFPLITGQLIPGFTGSGKIVEKIKRQAENYQYDVQIIDSSPGTGCPVNAAIRDANFVVLVVEPSLSGFSDIKNSLEVIKHFNIQHGVVINKWDLNEKITKKIKSFFKAKILGQISYNQDIFKKISNFKPIVKTDLFTKKEINDVFEKLKQVILN